MIVEACLGLVGLLLATYLWSQWRPKGYPPGPWGYPLLGHLPILGKAPFRTCMDLKAKYGPIVGVDFGAFPGIAISDYKMIREAMNEHAFTGRPNLQPFLDRSQGSRRGVLFSDGKEWMEQRKFTFRHLKEFGFGKNTTESVIIDELSGVVSHLRETSGQPVVIRELLNFVSINVIWTLTTSDRFEHGDPGLKRILDSVSTNIEENNGLAAVGMFIPWFTKLFPKLSGYEDMMKDLVPLLNFLDVPILHHKKTHVNRQPRDFLDVYIDEIKRTTDPKSSFYRTVGDISMRTVLFDLFTAGSETTSNSANWFCLYMSKYPVIQARLHSLIDSMIGRSRAPVLADRDGMPLMEATMLEILRITSIISTGIFRNTLEEVQFQGFVIPKDTLVLLNLYSCNHDAEFWGDPAVFRPERFLTQEGELMARPEAFMAFGAGKRACPGEKLALDEIFLIMATLLQNFTVLPNPEEPEVSMEPIVSFVLSPQPHTLVYAVRD